MRAGEWLKPYEHARPSRMLQSRPLMATLSAADALPQSIAHIPIELSAAPGPLPRGADTFRNRPMSSSG
jgi:hypothetical protein